MDKTIINLDTIDKLEKNALSKFNPDLIHLLSKTHFFPFLTRFYPSSIWIKSDRIKALKYKVSHGGLYRDLHGQVHMPYTIMPDMSDI